MTVRPARLNALIAVLFVVGSACFVIGSVPAYVDAVGGPVDGITYFVGSIFFTSASYSQLVQAQSPATTGVDAVAQNQPAPARLRGWLPHDRAWLAAATQLPGTVFFNVSTFAALAANAANASNKTVWRPDLFGSVLFLVSSAYGILAVSGRFLRWDTASLAWRIAWINMLGSALFMASALASYVLPTTNEVLDVRVSVAGTLLGAVCFLVGAALMFPAWRHDLLPAPAPTSQTP
jgi:hypothetical protein